MKRLIYLLPVIFILSFLSSCTTGDAGGSAGTDQADSASTIFTPVKVTALEETSIGRTIDYTANLAAFEEVHLASASPGRISKIYVEVGQHVRQGQLLVQMDETQLYQAEVQLRNLQTDFSRIDTLYAAGSSSKQQYDQIKTQLEVTRSNVEFLKENTRLVAPFSGIVTGKYFEDMEMYSGAPNTAAGKAAIISLMQINPVKAIINVSEAYFPQLKTGISARITLDIFPGEEFTGKIHRIYPTVDAMTRTFQVEIAIPNTKEQLRPGMFARVSLEMGEVMAIVVPAIALLQQQGTNERYVFIADNGKARRVTVTPGKRFNDRIEIISPEIAPGDLLVIAGQASLVQGSPIQIVD